MIKDSIVITKYRDKYVSWLDCNGKMEYLSVADCDNDVVGNVYLGRVKDVASNINACFVEVFDKKLGFLSFNDCTGDIPRSGDLVCVQVVKAASKNKEMMLSAKINLQGYLCAVAVGNGKVHVSKNIAPHIKGELKNRFNGVFSHDIIMRTNAASATADEIMSEATKLSELLDDILAKSNTRTAYTLLYSSKPDYMKFTESMVRGSYERIITDCVEVADTVGECELYCDEYPLIKLYSLESKLERILDKRVYLKSGGDIVIEHTEAMTVIDVNTGKNISKKEKEDMVLTTNTEAAIEIARQLRLRNISGIIIVDFINMKSEESVNNLIEVLKHELRKDKVRAEFADLTSLGLAEVVRKKTGPPLYELLK